MKYKGKNNNVTFKLFAIFLLILWGILSLSFILFVDDFVAIFTLGINGLISLVFAYLIYRFGFFPTIILVTFLSFEVLFDVILSWRLDLIRFLKIIVLIGVWLATYELWKVRTDVINRK